MGTGTVTNCKQMVEGNKKCEDILCFVLKRVLQKVDCSQFLVEIRRISSRCCSIFSPPPPSPTADPTLPDLDTFPPARSTALIDATVPSV
jgi:hypothetical protein